MVEAEALTNQKEAPPMKVGGAGSASSNSTAPAGGKELTTAEVLAKTSVEDLPTAEEQAAKELALVNGTPNPKPPKPTKPPVVELGKRETPE